MKQPSPTTPEASRAADDTLMALLGAAHRIEAQLESALAVHGLSMAKFGVLEALAHANAPLTLTELAGKLSCVRSNVTQLIDRLEADGLVRRVADEADRRSIRAVLTPEGVARAHDGALAFAQARRDVEAQLSDAEHGALSDALSRLV